MMSYYDVTRKPNKNKVKGGLKAQRVGADFERIFLYRCHSSGIAIDRLPDGCKVTGGYGGRPQLIRVKTPYDFICSYQGSFGLFDTKCFDGDHITASKVTDHQLASLLMHERQGAVSGYIVYFRPIDQVHFYSASALELIKKGIKEVPSKLLGTLNEFDVRILFQ